MVLQGAPTALCGHAPAKPGSFRCSNVFGMQQQHLQNRRRCWSTTARNNLGNKIQGELLDFVTAGPKMRKWYGQESTKDLPRDGGGSGEEEEPQPQEPQAPGPRDTILVTDADTPTGELVVLQLILARAKVRILVKDMAAAAKGYGPYVEAMSVDMGSAGGLARALRGVAGVIVLGRLGALLPAAQQAGVPGLVLLSTAGMPQPGGLAGLFQDAGDAPLKEPQREAAVAASGLPYVIVRAGIIEDVPGGSSSISVTKGAAAGSGGSGSNGKCSISREDLASAVVASTSFMTSRAEAAAAAGSSGGVASLVVQVQAAGPGQPPDYSQLLEALVEPAAKAAR